MTSASAATAASISDSELPSKLLIERKEFDDTCQRRFIFGPSFEPYGGTAGLFDYGPVLTAMKNNFLQLWRTHFIVEEQMCEIESPAVTPQPVLAASGHEERFNDTMVRDTVTGECIRLDKFVTEWFENRASDPKTSAAEKSQLRHTASLIESMTPTEIMALVSRHQIKSTKGNPLGEPFPFNLMFPSVIGPEGDKKAYLRPELAQGIFLNCKRLLDTGCAQRMPFAAATIGSAFRNEIAPRNALIRVREFTLAEIEHFMNPSDKRHAKFAYVKDVKIWAWPRESQEQNLPPTQATIGDLVEKKVIDNQTLGYFIARTHMFLNKVGARYVRFRQHLRTEMAHYAQDCWDAELLTSFGWCECVGIADRSAYDLEAHMKGSGKDLRVREQFAEPRIERVLVRELNKKAAAPVIGKEVGALDQYLMRMSDTEARDLGAKINAAAGPVHITLPSGSTVAVSKAFVTIEEKDIKRTGADYVPSVVEPSFGVGRILYAILEQSYYVRRDDTGKNEKRAVFALQANLAAQKVAVLPQFNKPQFEGPAQLIMRDFLGNGIPCRMDDSGVSIGKKYSRMDEIGIPYAITIDHETSEEGPLKDSVTLRERDSMQQVRVPVAALVPLIAALSRLDNPISWSKDVVTKFPPHPPAGAKEQS